MRKIFSLSVPEVHLRKPNLFGLIKWSSFVSVSLYINKILPVVTLNKRHGHFKLYGCTLFSICCVYVVRKCSIMFAKDMLYHVLWCGITQEFSYQLEKASKRQAYFFLNRNDRSPLWPSKSIDPEKLGNKTKVFQSFYIDYTMTKQTCHRIGYQKKVILKLIDVCDHLEEKQELT